MLQDKEEELERLNAELLNEETASEAEQEQEGLLNEEQLDAFLEDSTKIGSMEDTIVYQNFSNDYGAEEMVQDTPAEPEKKKDPVVVALTVLALTLLASIFGVLIWVLMMFRGV